MDKCYLYISPYDFITLVYKSQAVLLFFMIFLIFLYKAERKRKGRMAFTIRPFALGEGQCSFNSCGGIFIILIGESYNVDFNLITGRYFNNKRFSVFRFG